MQKRVRNSCHGVPNQVDLFCMEVWTKVECFTIFLRINYFTWNTCKLFVSTTFCLRTFLLLHKLNKWKTSLVIIAELSEIDTKLKFCSKFQFARRGRPTMKTNKMHIINFLSDQGANRQHSSVGDWEMTFRSILKKLKKWQNTIQSTELAFLKMKTFLNTDTKEF